MDVLSKSAEAVFPQLNEIIDKQMCLQKLQPHLSSEAWLAERIVSIRVYYPRKDTKSCRIRFRVEFQSKQTHAISNQIYAGQLTTDDNKARYAELKKDSWIKPEAGPPLIFIDEWDLLLWSFPNDPHLPQLGQLWDPHHILNQLNDFPHQFDLPSEHQINQVNVSLSKYVPLKRCGFVYQVTSDTTDDNTTYSLYAKAFEKSKGKHAFDRSQLIWRNMDQHEGNTYLPKPLHYDRDNHVAWYQGIPGQALSKILNQVDVAEMMERVAQQLAQFHNTQLSLSTTMSNKTALRQLKERTLTISEIYPEIAQRCNALGKTLEQKMEELGEASQTPIHGAFKLSHILVDGKTVHFIDFDQTGMGDPAYDVGTLFAHIHWLEQGGKISSEFSQTAINHFWDAYITSTNSPISRQKVNWYVAHQLLTGYLYKTIKRFRQPKNLQILALAEALVSKG